MPRQLPIPSLSHHHTQRPRPTRCPLMGHVLHHQMRITKQRRVKHAGPLHAKRPPRLALAQQARQRLQRVPRRAVHRLLVDRVGAACGRGGHNLAAGAGGDLLGRGAAQLVQQRRLHAARGRGRAGVELLEQGRVGRVEVQRVEPGVAEGKGYQGEVGL